MMQFGRVVGVVLGGGAGCDVGGGDAGAFGGAGRVRAGGAEATGCDSNRARTTSRYLALPRGWQAKIVMIASGVLSTIHISDGRTINDWYTS